MDKEQRDVFCPSCNILISAPIIASGFGSYRSDAMSPLDELDAEYHGEHYFIALCPRCSGPFLGRASIWGVPGEFETVTDEKILFPCPTRERIEGLPDPVARAYEGAVKSYGATLYEPSALMCRRCLEAVCKHFSAQGRDLNKRLDALAVSGTIDSRLKDWAHGVRLLGNEAAHDVDASVSKEDARDVLDFTEAMLLFVFTLREKHERFLARRVKAAPRGAV
jgi:hypothetical protein